MVAEELLGNSMVAETLNDDTQVLRMFFWCCAGDQDVVNVGIAAL